MTRERHVLQMSPRGGRRLLPLLGVVAAACSSSPAPQGPGYGMNGAAVGFPADAVLGKFLAQAKPKGHCFPSVVEFAQSQLLIQDSGYSFADLDADKPQAQKLRYELTRERPCKTSLDGSSEKPSSQPKGVTDEQWKSPGCTLKEVFDVTAKQPPNIFIDECEYPISVTGNFLVRTSKSSPWISIVADNKSSLKTEWLRVCRDCPEQ